MPVYITSDNEYQKLFDEKAKLSRGYQNVSLAEHLAKVLADNPCDKTGYEYAKAQKELDDILKARGVYLKAGESSAAPESRSITQILEDWEIIEKTYHPPGAGGNSWPRGERLRPQSVFWKPRRHFYILYRIPRY